MTKFIRRTEEQGPNLRLNNSDITKLLNRVLGLHSRWDNDIFAQCPVNGGVHTILVSGLKRIDDSQDLSSIPASGGWVTKDQSDFLVGVDDEDGADGHGNSCGSVKSVTDAPSRFMAGNRGGGSFILTLLVNICGVLVIKHIIQI